MNIYIIKFGFWMAICPGIETPGYKQKYKTYFSLHAYICTRICIEFCFWIAIRHGMETPG